MKTWKTGFSFPYFYIEKNISIVNKYSNSSGTLESSNKHIEDTQQVLYIDYCIIIV